MEKKKNLSSIKTTAAIKFSKKKLGAERVVEKCDKIKLFIKLNTYTLIS